MCEYGRDNIKLSRAFDGSGVRVRRMLEKAMRGEAIGVGVSTSCISLAVTQILNFFLLQIIGASVTVGHGMPLGAVRWWEQFQLDFAKMFPNTTFHNGAIAAMDSAHYSAPSYRYSADTAVSQAASSARASVPSSQRTSICTSSSWILTINRACC